MQRSLREKRPPGRAGAGILVCLALLLPLFGCSEEGNPPVVSLAEREDISAGEPKPSGEMIRIAVGGMITPREGYVYYRRLLDFVGERMGRRVHFIDREDYGEINRMMKAGNIDVAFVCGGPYVEGREDFGMTLLVSPRSHGGTVYHSYIIVHRDSPLQQFSDLRGKVFAFTDPLSNSGRLVPVYMLARTNETPRTFFGEVVYTYAHDKSIQAVAQGIVDGAAVDSLIWEYASHVDPRFTSLTRIITKSPPYGIPPVVIRPGLDAALAGELKELFLHLHEDERGREILDGMMIDRFVPIADSAYDGIRAMKAWLKGRAGQEAGGGAP